MLTPDQAKALDDFKSKYGRHWKSTLTRMWASGQDAHEPGGCFLRQVRNGFGPKWLAKQ